MSVELRQAKGGAGSDRVAVGVGLLCIWHCDARAKVPKRQGRAVEGARWICLNANGFAFETFGGAPAGEGERLERDVRGMVETW